MIRRPPRSTLFPLHDALPISGAGDHGRGRPVLAPAQRPLGGGVGLVAHADVVGVEEEDPLVPRPAQPLRPDRKSTRLNSSHANISYAVFCLKKKKRHLIEKEK